MPILNKSNTDKILIKLKDKIETNNGLKIFGRSKASFEDWFKVELCGILSEYDESIIPEKDDIDITSDNMAIELKTFIPNGAPEGVNAGIPSKNVTQNREGIIKDFTDLRDSKRLNAKERAVLFVVFPITKERKNWEGHRLEIEKKIGALPKPIEFTFKSTKINGLIYFVLAR
jgi:hypothetical protein